MARFRRGFRAAPARRMNWIARTEGWSTSAYAAQATPYNITLLDPTDSAQEIGRYVNPTLTRIRGQIVLDPEMPADASFVHGAYFLYLYVAEDAKSTYNASIISSDDIIWTGAGGSSRGAAFLGGATQSLAQYWIQHQVLEVDVKAQRKMKDNNKLFLGIHVSPNTGGGSAAMQLRIGYQLRMLIKE